MNSPAQCLEILSNFKTENRVFALLDGKEITTHQLLVDVKINAAVLAQQEHRRYGIYCQSSYQFIVGLFAALVSRKQIAVLPNMQVGFVEAINSNVDCLLTDLIDPKINLQQYLVVSDTNQVLDLSFDEIDNSNASLSFFTSGSTGIPTQIYKKLTQLEKEVEALEGLWGDQIQNSIVRSTVSHQHLYGFLFKILWPLSVGRVIDLEPYPYPEPLVNSINALSPTVLVSSPALLNRIVPSDHFGSCRENVKAVFSSGGPLKASASINTQEVLNVPVYEVFGSTETGGVAYRCQSEEQGIKTPWTVFPSVTIDVEMSSTCLKVRSSHLPDLEWFTMSDGVELLNERQFLLSGRVDRIVKIEEKRLSLVELEKKLNESEWIEESCAIVLDNKRVVVAVAAELTEEGRVFLSEKGKRTLNQQLKNYLETFFEPVVLPRKWRFIDRLPTNSQGKVAMADIQALFEKGSDVVTWPNIDSTRTADTDANLQLTMPEKLVYFDGHFDGKPIVPGVVQIDWAIKFGRELLGINGDFQRLEVIKFHEFIEPLDQVELKLSYNTDKQKLSFEYNSKKGKHSSGRIVFN